MAKLLLEKLAARVAYWHASGIYRRFQRALQQPGAVQQRVLRRVLRLVGESEFGRRHGLRRVATLDDLRRAVPLRTYADYHAYIERVGAGETAALFSPGTRVHMFATSSGTTAVPKHIPVTGEFIADYRRGWNTFGLKLLTDHPEAILRDILQSTGRADATRTRAGIPCGAITGLLAATQKRIVRRFYVGRPEIAQLDDPLARYYTLMRLAAERDVAFAITASPATLIQLARAANEQAEVLIRDVREGTLCGQFVPREDLRRLLAARLRPNPARAAELERLRARHGALRPKDLWQLAFVACWTGGSMGYYLERLREWWGAIPVRDIGLLASEGRVSIPLSDNSPIGVLDVTSAVFEFIPAERAEEQDPPTIDAAGVEQGRDYVVVLSNTTGLLRYRLDDVVRVRGHVANGVPLVEFLHRAGRVASISGEKLTENQVVAAVMETARKLGLPEFDFLLAPCWDDPPYYRLTCACAAEARLAREVDAALAAQNEEYASRRSSLRLGDLVVRYVPAAQFVELDRRLIRERGGSADQYKRPCLATRPGDDDRMLNRDRSAS